MLWCIVEVVHIDINYEVSTLSRYLANTRTGHLVQAIHIFKYLEIHRQNQFEFDPMYQDIKSDKDTGGNIYEMKYQYINSIEYIPPNSPKPIG